MLGRLSGLLLALLLLPASPYAQELDLSGALGEETPAEQEAGEGATGRELPAELDAGQDRAIAERLRAIFAGVETLRDVRVEVRAGLVRLSGETPTSAARELAGQLARQSENVALVENEITLDQDVDRRLETAWEKLQQRLWGLIGMLPLLAVAAVVLVLFWFLGRLFAAWEAPYRRIGNAFLRRGVQQFVRVAILLGGGLIALEILDATALVTALLGTAGLFGLVLGFAFRDLAENLIASLLLSLRQPFAPNDFVRIEGHEGHVVRLTSRATVLLTIDGNHIRIPNATVYKGLIVNYTRNPLRRFDFTAGIGVGEDLSTAGHLGKAALEALPGVLSDPAPQAFVEALGDWAVIVRYTGWIDQRTTDFLKLRSEAIRRVKEALDAAGISLPEPTYALRLQKTGEPVPTREARPRPEVRAEMPDIQRENVVERQVAAERAAGGIDLLSSSAPSEL